MSKSNDIPDLFLPGLIPSHENRRVLIAEAWNATPHLETGAEIAARLSKSGYKIDYLFYGHLLPYVEWFNKTGSTFKRKLNGEVAPQNAIQDLLKKHISDTGRDLKIIKPPLALPFCFHSIPPIYLESLDKLKKYSPLNYENIGLSVASSLVYILSDSLVLPSLHKDLCNKLATSYQRSYTIMRKILKSNVYFGAVLFNGRFACIKGAVDACRNLNVKTFYHERGSTKDKFSLTDYQPHNRKSVQREIKRRLIKKCDSSEPEVKQAINFFVSRRNGVPQNWLSFTEHQKPGFAAQIVKEARARSKTGIVITFYTSSEDEFVAVDDAFQKDLFEWKSQSEAFCFLTRCAFNLGHSVILRQHPHVAKKSPADAAKWSNLDFLDSKLRTYIYNLEPSSSPSSYELIDASDLVACYGSTIGIESVFWGRPSILLANSLYDETGASIYQPKTAFELNGLLSNPSCLIVKPETALSYGYYMASFGYDYSLYKAHTLFSGAFCGANSPTGIPSRRLMITQKIHALARRLVARHYSG